MSAKNMFCVCWHIRMHMLRNVYLVRWISICFDQKVLETLIHKHTQAQAPQLHADIPEYMYARFHALCIYLLCL